MIDFFAHFGFALGFMIVDVLFCAFITLLWSRENADISDDLLIVLTVVNTVGFAIALSFLFLG